MTAYYNEFDPFASAWLRNLVAAGHIADGVVDSRSIVDVQPEDLEGRNETHFFAGIGVWSRAIRDAGWPTARVPVWTGSAPCQPFSVAGRQQGSDDERHLWPAWFRLVDECRPPVIVGEQVASNAALAWWDAVQADLEAAGYACGVADLCAAGLGAPHIRQRLWWVAVRRDFDRLADAQRYLQSRDGLRAADRAAGAAASSTSERERGGVDAGRGGAGNGLADAGGVGLHREPSARVHGRWTGASGEESAAHGTDGTQRDHDAGCGIADRLADTGSDGPQGRVSGGASAERSMVRGSPRRGGATDGSRATNGAWRDADWLRCRDGKWRPVEPGTFPLAHGSAARVGRLRGYGNAIALPVATWWVSTVMDVLGLRGTP